MASLENLLIERFMPAFEVVAGERVDPVVRRSQHADFQADGALPLARTLGRAPREIATEVLQRANLAGLVESAAISGPGFINVRFSDSALTELLAAVNADARLGVVETDIPETVVIDYSTPNVAKEMHVGHLRSCRCRTRSAWPAPGNDGAQIGSVDPSSVVNVRGTTEQPRALRRWLGTGWPGATFEYAPIARPKPRLAEAAMSSVAGVQRPIVVRRWL